MLTAEIKINGRPIALIEAMNTKTISDKSGDFIGDPTTVREYSCRILETQESIWAHKDYTITVVHDAREGWQGLVNKITGKILPVVVETISEEDR